MMRDCLALSSLVLAFACVLTLAPALWADAMSKGDAQSVNIAKPEWGTLITASTVFSNRYSPGNLADGEMDGEHCWFGQDGAALPQQITFAFAGAEKLEGLRIVQAKWQGEQYRSKDFTAEVSMDGQAWTQVGAGTVPVDAGAECKLKLKSVDAKWLRIAITSAYDSFRTCGFAEVEILASKPKGTRPPYAGATRDLRWETFGRKFVMQIELDPPAPMWVADQANTADAQTWTSGPYKLDWRLRNRGAAARIVEYALARTDGEPFRVVKTRLDAKTSYAGVYKIFHPGTMAQQNYKIDLPFHLDGVSRAEDSTPVAWMQQADGGNTFAVGMLDQIPVTRIGGSTYDTGNGGEAPGIANSYARVSFERTYADTQPVKSFRDGIYINTDKAVSWFDALRDYAGAVDAWRGFAPHAMGKNALRPMWHSWYAHADVIDQAQLLDDAKHAAALGVKTLEIDAGWNVPKGVGYCFEVEGDYDFTKDRFPDAPAMIAKMHDLGLAVVLHVGPLLMGKQSKAYAEMKDAILQVKGAPTAYLDPRLVKTRDYLVAAWTKLTTDYKIDGLWYDFLEIPETADPPAEGAAVISTDLHEAYTLLMKALYEKALSINPDAVIILRRGSANLNSKTYLTHVWPMDTPQDYNMNRRDIVYLKTLGDGVATHACCTSWPISESDENVARQMASITLAGVPAFSVKLAESPESHNAIIRAWLEFYDKYKESLMLGAMTPLLPTPPSAAVRIESDTQAFFGFFEAMPGLVQTTRPVEKVVLVDALTDRLVTRLEGVTGDYKAEVFDQAWKSLGVSVVKNDGKGLALDFSAPTKCFSVVLERQIP